MEIPRQKKTVRVAVTGPSVKKGVIRCPVQNRRADASIRAGAARYYHESLEGLWCAVPRIKTPTAPTLTTLFASEYLGTEFGVFYLLSFLLRRETVC